MTLGEAMSTLESLGTEQNRKVYRRHGMGDNLFGVSFAELEKLRKKIKTSQELARGLWASGNGDARNLALLIADPQAMSAGEIEEWLGQITCYTHADLFARHVAARSPAAVAKMAEWMESPRDFIGQAGWDLLAIRAMNDASLAEAELEAQIGVIEARIHSANNRTKHAMNMALIAIGLRSEGLRKLAIAAARRIGKVVVDHGETGCKTPDVVAYIEKAEARKAKKAAG